MSNEAYTPVAVDLTNISDDFAPIDYELDMQAQQYHYSEDRTEECNPVVRMAMLAELLLSS